MAHITDIDLEQYDAVHDGMRESWISPIFPDNADESGQDWSRQHDHNQKQEVINAKNILQDGLPTFVPTFSDLRRDCLSLASMKLKSLEESIVTMQAGPDRDEAIEGASRLLQNFDRQFDTIISRYRLAEAEYTEQRGLRVYNFTVDHGDRKGDWTMLASGWGQDSQSIVESEPDNRLHKKWMKAFNGNQDPSVVVFKRRKTLHERQWRALRLVSGVVVRNRWMIMLWKILIPLGVFCFTALIGVMVIANTTTMSPIFEKYFFWFGVLWAVLSTTLLAGLVRVFGGNSRDCVVACLATVGLCFVGAQLGQLQLATQGQGVGGS